MTWKEQLRHIIEANWRCRQKFRLAEVYHLALPSFRRRYIESKTLRESLRFWLQRLRDEEVIEFVDNRGTYRRLQ
jgi:hypothetical protein